MEPADFPQLKETLPPGAMLGLLGGGQLGMFFTQAAQRLGYRVCCFTSGPDDPAARFADSLVIGEFEDPQLIEQFSNQIAAATYEFESIPATTLRRVAERVPMAPSFDVIHSTQDRLREKQLLQSAGIPLAPFAAVASLDDLRRGCRQLDGGSLILKTATEGYDGKGQWSVDDDTDLEAVWSEAERPCTLERRVRLDSEVSVLVAGDRFGGRTLIGPICNRHRNHILDLSYVADDLSSELAGQAKAYALRLAERFSLVGIICVEYFVTAEGDLLVNELAPRPHNSGHLTIEGFSLSQYDLQALAVSGQPVAPAQQLTAVAMANLLGDLWGDGAPAFERAAAEVAAGRSHCAIYPHFYGKADPKPGRKMGHVTVSAPTNAEAIQLALAYREICRRSPE